MSELSKALVRLDEWRHDNYSTRIGGVAGAVYVLRAELAATQAEVDRLRAEIATWRDRAYGSEADQ